MNDIRDKAPLQENRKKIENVSTVEQGCPKKFNFTRGV